MNRKVDLKNVIAVMTPIKGNDVLKTVPHRLFLDMAVVYYEKTTEREKPTSYSLIRNSDIVDIPEEALYYAAMYNTKEAMKYEIRKMSEIIFGQALAEDFMYVIGNINKKFCASALLYPEILREVSSKVNGKIYIIPSSTHEIICVPANINTINELREMVTSINASVVDSEDFLSNSVYVFDPEKGVIEIA